MESSTGTQVLSISYGAFSIRLEGFGDPFPIMKRVTEYFRQVASTDTSFGTLPLEEQHMQMGQFAQTLSNEGTGVSMDKEQVVLSPEPIPARSADQIQFDDPANTIVAPDPAVVQPAPSEPVEPPSPTAEEIALQLRAEREALSRAMSSAKQSAERDDEIRRRLDIIRDQTMGVTERYDTKEEEFRARPNALLTDHAHPEEEDLDFIHPLKSRFKRLRKHAAGARSDGATRLQLSSDMRTIKIGSFGG